MMIPEMLPNRNESSDIQNSLISRLFRPTQKFSKYLDYLSFHKYRNLEFRFLFCRK
jgi:hypothetical protein